MIRIAEKEFSDYEEYDFSNQLFYLRWFCISLALNERKRICDKAQKKQYCEQILKDQIVKETPLNLYPMNVSLKQKVFQLLVKLSLSKAVSSI